MARHGRPATRARTEAGGGQLDLFGGGGAAVAPAVAPVAVAGAPPPARRPSPERSPAATIPPVCPVTGTAVCYRGDCRHYSAGACVHPGARKEAAGRRTTRPPKSA